MAWLWLSRNSPNPGIECEVAINIPVSVSKFQRVSTTCHLGLLLASAFRLPAGLLYQVYQCVQFYLENVGPYRCNRNSAISSYIIATIGFFTTYPIQIQKIMFASQPGHYFNGILNTDLPDLPLIVPNIRLRHTSVKMARLTNFDRKGVQIFFTNKPLTLKMWLPLRIVRFY